MSLNSLSTILENDCPFEIDIHKQLVPTKLILTGYRSSAGLFYLLRNCENNVTIHHLSIQKCLLVVFQSC